MSGEILELLSTRSVLRHGLEDCWSWQAFDESVARTMSEPGALSASLFGLRSASLLVMAGGDNGRARLSGLLGAELVAARPCWFNKEVLVVGNGEQADAAATTLAGLCAALGKIGARA